MFEVSYRLVGDETKKEYMITCERQEEAMLIWESLLYLHNLYILTSTSPR